MKHHMLRRASQTPPSRLTLALVALMSLSSALYIGCESQPTQCRINLDFKALDTNNQPLDDVVLIVNNVELNFTQDGQLNDGFPITAGVEVNIKLQPPEGYRITDPHVAGGALDSEGYEIVNSTEFTLLVPQDSPEMIEKRIVAHFAPPNRDYLFVIEGKPESKVLVSNQELATIDRSKRAMFFYSGAPGNVVLIQVGDKAYEVKLAFEREAYLITDDVQAVLGDSQEQIRAVNAEPAADQGELYASNDAIADPAETDTVEEIAQPMVQPAAPPKPTKRRKRRTRTPEEIEAARARREERARLREEKAEARRIARAEAAEERRAKREEQARIREDKAAAQREARAEAARIRQEQAEARLEAKRRREAEAAEAKRQREAEAARRRAERQATTRVASRATSSSGNSSSSQTIRINQGSQPTRNSGSSGGRGGSDVESILTGRSTSGNVSKSEAKRKVKEIESRYKTSRRLFSQDIAFLKSLNKSHGYAYNSGHRLLGLYYHSLKDYKRQRDSLIIATKRGRYKNSAVILLSLAQAYGHFKQYSSALKVLRRAELKMGREKGAVKANIYKTYAEYARLLYIAQKARNPRGANTSLLDTAISKWQRLKALRGGGSSDGRLADRKIKELEGLKNRAQR